MTQEYIFNEYFNWMCTLVCSRRSLRQNYRKLLEYLNSREFTYIIDLDGNRAADGIELRYRFGREHRYSEPMIATYLDDRPCSVLEMLVALSIRCEEHIMDDPEMGDRTGYWFWNMMENLELKTMTDTRFDILYVDEVIDRFLNREYGRNGEGGLVTVHSPRPDLRTTDIWYQMMWYLDEVLEKQR